LFHFKENLFNNNTKCHTNATYYTHINSARIESSAELSTLDIPTDFLIGARKAVCAAQAT